MSIATRYEKHENYSDVSEIPASTIRSGLAELELKTSEVLQKLENIRTTTITGNSDDSESRDNNLPTTDGNSTNSDTTINTISHSYKNAMILPRARKPPAEILKSLENLVSHNDSDEDAEFILPALDDVSHLALISHSIVAYLSHLNKQHLFRVVNNIAGDTTSWLGMLFHFLDPGSSFHTDNADAILYAVRLAIVARCPGFLEGGIPALAHPCFYISENTTSVRLQFACRQLGIPLDAIRLIPANRTFGTMDLALLQKQIQTDLNANCTPLLVVADVSASLCGYVDNLLRMHELCATNKIWLHATGHGLAALACSKAKGNVGAIADSIVLNLGSWLGVPSLPIVLLHRQLQNSALAAFESDPISSRRLNALSVWTSLQALGHDNISERINIAFQTCCILFEITSKCEGIRVVSRAPGGQDSFTLNDVVEKPFDVNLLFETVTPVVVFQFDGSTAIPLTTKKTPQDYDYDGNDVVSLNSIKPLEKVNNSSYFDRLNSWLGQILQRRSPNIKFQIIEHQTHGTCIRYCPFELNLGEQPPTSNNLENFSRNLEAEVDVLRATIKHKATFMQLVEMNNVLRLVNLPVWAGMGSLRYVPEGWETLLTDQAKTELNKLNFELFEALKSTDEAFSLGESTDGMICVCFGMVTHETDVEELLDLVMTVGKSVQENCKVLDTMSEIVKKGIEAATADLQRETEEKLWQEGILRHVPVVGRVFNWWSPPTKETGVKGRSLNLTQGVVESTENIYKYHMQMSGAMNQLPANKSPPTPMVQTPVISYNATLSQVIPKSNTDDLNAQETHECNATSESGDNSLTSEIVSINNNNNAISNN